MKNRIKKIMLLLYSIVAIVGVCANNLKVNAASFPNTISGIKSNEVLSYNGYDQLFYKTYSNGVLFCSSFHISSVGTSCTISSSQWSNATQAGVAAIVNKYNNSPSKQNYYYAELALNEFLYYYETKDSNNKISKNRDVRNTSGVKSFYDAAVTAYQNANKKFEVKINAESGKLTFKLDNNYYISNKLTVSGTNKYSVSLSGNDKAQIYNQSGSSFYIKVPENSIKPGQTITINVKVTGTNSVNVAKKYSCGSGKQYLVPNITIANNINSSASLSGSITKEEEKITKLRISKQDITTKKELPGATLELRKDGKLIDKWVSTAEPYYVEGLEPGNYTLSETIAPDGYKLSEDTIEFTLEADNKVKEIVMYNMHEQKYKVKISKQDITTKKELPGATLIIKDSEGNELYRWVSTTEPYYLELEKGEYTLSEIQAPSGYDLSYEVIKFSVGDNGEVETAVVMYNSKTPDTSDKNIIIIVGTMLIAILGVGLSVYKLKHQKD